MKNSRQGFIALSVLIATIVILIIGGAYVYLRNNQANQTQSTSTVSSTTVNAAGNFKIKSGPYPEPLS